MVAKTIQYDVDRKGPCFNVYDSMLNIIKKELMYEKIIIGTSGNKSGNRSVIYVLGGGQDVLSTRFQIASILYHQGLSNKILMLARAGTTEFDPDLRRNLTNDEWSIRELERFHVRKEDIEVVRIQLGLLGTANEAKNLPKIVREKGFNRLILVTSAYHTKRAFAVFSPFASECPIELYIYGAEDKAGKMALLEEYIKLFLYEKIVIPAYGMIGRAKFGTFFTLRKPVLAAY